MAESFFLSFRGPQVYSLAFARGAVVPQKEAIAARAAGVRMREQKLCRLLRGRHTFGHIAKLVHKLGNSVLSGSAVG